MKPRLSFFCIILLFSCCNIFAGLTQVTGDTILVGGKKLKLLSDNLIANPGFESGLSNWTDASTTAAQLAAANFTIVSTGGVNNSKYLVGTASAGAGSSGSLGTGWSIQSGKTYCFYYKVKYQDVTLAAGSGQFLKVSLTNDKTASAEPYVLLGSGNINGSGQWTQNYSVFTNSSSYSYIVARFRWLNSQYGFDDFALFEVREVVDIAGLQATINEAQAIYKPSSLGATEFLSAINLAKGYLTSLSAVDVLNAISNLRSAITSYKYANTSQANPLDVTGFIANPSFESSFTGWTNTGMSTQSNTGLPGKDGTYYIEKWVNRGTKVSNISVRQQLTGIPNGNYTLIAIAGNIQQVGSGSTLNNSSTPQTGVALFAGIKSVAVDTIKERRINFTVVDNLVSIGLKAESATGNWVTCDNLRLCYLGQYNNNDYALYINDIVAKARIYQTKNVQNPVKTTLNAAIAKAQLATSANPLVSENLTAARVDLESAINAAEASLQLYSNLQDAIDYAGLVLSWYSDDQTKKDLLQPAILAANTAKNNLDLTQTEINKAVSDLNTIVKSVDKQIYIPVWMMGDVSSATNNWSYTRCKQSKNWILFWEPGFGDNPGTTVDDCLALAEKCFQFYSDSLKFTTRGASKTDTYKMIIRLRYSTEWEASGSGVDDRIGLLTLTPWALSSRGGQTIAHEVGHCFQYQVHCDNNDTNGWLYGFGVNASGGNGWWEQCAQWQAFKVFPSMQFTSEWFAGYLSHVHKHILHESPRYENCFIQDYWVGLRGRDIIGRLWNKSAKPEDPVETYKRLTGITQSQFNDEMYDCAAKFATWDIPALKSYGASKITLHPQPKLNDVGNSSWMIDSTVCLENYGHNIIKLNVPSTAKTVTVAFEGKAGINGFRKNYVSSAGWRYGFVALKSDGTRIYSEMKTVGMSDKGGKSFLSFDCPAGCSNLWLVVSGAPLTHWRHAWDNDDSNDEQWPYQVKFNNTNLLGYQNVISSVVTAIEETDIKSVQINTIGSDLSINQLPENSIVRIYTVIGSCILNKQTKGSSFSVTLPSGYYIVNIRSDNRNYNKKILVQ